MIRKVLLINSPRISDEILNAYSAKDRFFEIYPPVGLLYLAAMVRRELPGVDVAVRDLHLEGLRASRAGKPVDWEGICARWIDELRPDLVGLSCMFGSSYDFVRRCGLFIRGRYPGLIIVGGGVHITGLAKEGEVDDFFDFVCLNEAEHHFCGLLRYLNGNQDVLQGVVACNGKLLRDPLHVRGGNLTEDVVDNLPPPDWSLIDLGSYYRYGRLSASQTYPDDVPVATLLTERGCTARCTFCSVRNFNGFSVRGHSPERVLREIDILYNDHGVRHIDLLDDDFTYDRARVMAIMEGLVRRDYRLTLSMANGVRLGTLDDHMLGAMVAAKVSYFSLGIESGDPDILHKVKKPLTLDLLWKKVPLLHKHPEIYYRANFIVGFPGETERQMDLTFQLARDMSLDWSLFSICKALPNTEMYEDLVTQGKAPGERGNRDYAFDAVSGIANTALGGQYIFDLAYQRNLEINFRDNVNLRGRDVGRAVRDFERVTTIADDHAVAWNCLARGYRQLNRPEEAGRAARRVCEILDESETWRSHFRRIGMEPETPRVSAPGSPEPEPCRTPAPETDRAAAGRLAPGERRADSCRTVVGGAS
jgi:radical SAM superfamily enzyme YgiQ (UPF0313 family)